MRLIDADALKKAINELFFVDEYTVEKTINNAPTVEVHKIGHKLYNEGFKDGVDQGVKLSEGIKGKWITKGYEPYGRCIICGEICEINNFCGNCGADMRGEENDK